ncbi:MAG: DUF1491 family protein [Sphingomonas sp.]|uniref:DUF1491 family protein n=1 Tax=Sphingomonas sp. TaxID=28214 RepID=UPI001B290936|nr:DUF1491 family protein [Sphingomonas sp.]MBO9621935.1 DUF1491 family protein [Sphingomonas sp.]
MARLATAALVNALVRRANQQGGSAMVLARGDDTAGGILFLAYERGRNPRFFERGLGPRGTPELLSSGPRELADEEAVTAYWQRRRERDRDLWVLELDIAEAERFTAETMALS